MFGSVPFYEFMSVVNTDLSLPSLLFAGSSFETNSHHRPIHFNNSGQSVESVNDGFSSYLVSPSLPADSSCAAS